MTKKILFFAFIFFRFLSFGQEINWGYSVGLAFSFGTEVNRIGFHSSVFANYNFAQVNAAINGYYNFKSLGKREKTVELQLGGGAQFGFGRKDTIQNNFIGLTENNTFHDYAAGFAFIRYWDQQGTSQSTGILNANILNVNLITENDLFGNLVRQRDRYRTGAFLIEYQYENTKVGINALLWTYDYAHCAVIVDENSEKWARFGYYEDDFPKNRSTSLGILSISVKQWLPYHQTPHLALGINSEKVRNVVQNEFIHDQPFFPSSWVRRKPAHIPMFTPENQQYLHLEGQEIKPAKFYFDVGLNTLPFY